ncbi:methyl-accepting chemotaxis protein [Clostridium sp. SYSU_GA19001]|uniref:methyl-accepting chemotaxis protein n=1 Tax=Clostridium caldaquaticum TaxID=2940653 RepID=UPI00207715F3|nr:methyl-accepting chemotaxis protein [Clostridium caldaquaticum]MCM8711556.1 methyl-accepting chemotaxis protein [Clostridium caldaquaticum]
MNFSESFKKFLSNIKNINLNKFSHNKFLQINANKIALKMNKIKSNLSLKKQMTIVFTSISIIPILLMGVFIFSKVYNQMYKSQRNMLEAYAEGVKNNVNTVIADSNSILKSLSSQSDLLVLMQENLSTGQIKEAVKLNKVIISMENAIESSEKLYETIFIADINGKVIADGSIFNHKYEKLNISNTDYFKMIKNGEKFYVGEPMKSIATENYVIPVAASIETKADKMGLIVIMFDLSKFTSNMNDIKVGDNGFLYIVSKNGNIIYHKNKDLLLKKVENNLVNTELSNFQKGQSIKGFKFYNESGISSVAAYSSIKNAEWLVVTSMSRKEFMRSITEIGIFIFILVLLMILIALTVSLKYSKDVTNPIFNIGKLMKEVASGNINVKAEHNENIEIKKLSNDFNEMTKNLRDLISKVINVSNAVSSASDNFVDLTTKAFESAKLVSDSIEHIAAGTQEQAAAVEMGANKIEQIAENISLISKSADIMMEASNKTDFIVHSGIKEMQLLNIKADDTERISEEVCNEALELTYSIKEIENILLVIENIANQTNLLALNAAIEAAHAGESGRGFSVVAEEVKKLSQISYEKTREITQIIRKLENKSENVQNIVNKSKAIVSEQNISVRNMEEALNNICLEAGKVKNIISDIYNKIGDINAEKNMMLEVVNNISIVANNTASDSDTVSSAAGDQFAIMKEMKQNCAKLNKLSVDLIDSLNIFTKRI